MNRSSETAQPPRSLGHPLVAGALADYACAMRQHGLDAPVRQAATRAVIDWVGATVAGSTLEPAQILTAVLCPECRGASRIVGSELITSCRTAALVNGTAAHTAEVDDIYRDGVYHPGAPTIAAALALADRKHSSGLDFLHAITIGYEVGNRVAVAVNPSHYRYWHTTGTIGTLGAAAAAAEILCLDARRWAHALATAATMAAGLQQAFRSDSMSKPLHAGHAAEAGVLAAVAAGRGFTGAPDVLEGEAGLGAAMSEEVDWSGAMAALGEPQTILETTLKPHACCGHAFAAVDAALELREQGVSAEQIDAIVVETYAAATSVAGNAEPSTAVEAKFSIPYCVAVALATGSVQLDAFEKPVLSQPSVRELVRRVVLVVDPEFEKAFPHQRAARVIINDRSGRTHTVERKTRKGDPDDPLTDDEVGRKFGSLVSPVLGEARASELVAALRHVANLSDVMLLPLGVAG